MSIARSEEEKLEADVRTGWKKMGRRVGDSRDNAVRLHEGLRTRCR